MTQRIEIKPECLPMGAFASVASAQLPEPYCYLSNAQKVWCEQRGLDELAAHLPCWVPQRVVSTALLGARGVYQVETTAALHGPWVWATEFSNVHVTFRFKEPGFEIGGVRYAGPEDYFQLAKSEGMPDHAAAVAAMACSSGPLEAYDIGRAHRMRPDWEAVKVEVMRTAVTAKFTQNLALKELLLSTGNHPLVQLKPQDAYWGTGADGRGRNQLGVLLMELRAAIREEATG